MDRKRYPSASAMATIRSTLDPSKPILFSKLVSMAMAIDTRRQRATTKAIKRIRSICDPDPDCASCRVRIARGQSACESCVSKRIAARI